MKLPKDQFENARRFIKLNANDIDCAMFDYYFENKPLEEVTDILSRYQNEF